MANWLEYIGKALNRLKRKSKPSSLPQLAPGSLVVSEVEISDETMQKQEKEVKESLPYRLFEKMRRRSLSWKSYYYQNEYGIVDIAIANDDATRNHINERNYLVDEEGVLEGNLYTNEEASNIYLTSEYLDNIPEELFDKLVESEVSFLVFDKKYPLEVLFHSDMDKKNSLFFLGHHKVYIKDDTAYLLRPFRNIGASGFYALTNQMLIQEGIPIDKKSFVESLLIELGDKELLESYQSALNLYNRQVSVREALAVPEEDDIPLIITEARKHSRSKKDSQSIANLVKTPTIPYESYDTFAKILEDKFDEIEFNLLNISIASIELDRFKVSEELSLLSNKLRKYTEQILLEEMNFAKLYNFMNRFSLYENESKEIQKKQDYSLLEDEAYEQILIDTMEAIEEIYSDPRYIHYTPIRNRLDGFMEVIRTLDNVLQDAYEKHKRREVDDRREILLKKPFELSNDRTYERNIEEGEISYYEKLLQVNKAINDILEREMNYAAYHVSKNLAKSGYMMIQMANAKSEEVDRLSEQLLEMVEMHPSEDYASFEENFIQKLANISSDIHEIMDTEMSEKLTVVCANLASFRSSNEIFSEQEWTESYKGFIESEVVEFNEEISSIANERYMKVTQKVSYQHELVDIFVSGISYPALLPATLHEKGEGLQTYLVQSLQEYLATQDLQLHTVPGREKQLRPLINELVPVRLDKPLKKLEYYFKLSTT